LLDVEIHTNTFDFRPILVLKGANKEVQGFKITFFADKEHRKCTSNSVLPK
jgi:hypothetical protein